MPAAMKAMKTHKAFVKSRMRYPVFLRGAIFGLHLAGWTYQEIVDEVAKPDGSETSIGGVASAIAQAKANGGLLWDGDVKTISSAGRPRKTTCALDRKIVQLVFKHRGRALVTPMYVRICNGVPYTSTAPGWASGARPGRRLGRQAWAQLPGCEAPREAPPNAVPYTHALHRAV